MMHKKKTYFGRDDLPAEIRGGANMKTMEQQFSERVLAQMQTAEREKYCRTGRLLAQIEKFGALGYTKAQFRRGRVCDGFDELAEAGQLALSIEALAVSKQFGELFTDEEADFCLQALLEAGYYQR